MLSHSKLWLLRLHDGPVLPQQEAGHDTDDWPGAGLCHHRLPPVRDRAQRGDNIHQGEEREASIIHAQSWRNEDSKCDPFGEIRTHRLIFASYLFVAKTKLDLNYISINCHHILPTIRPLLLRLFLNIHVFTNCDKIAWFKGSNFSDNSTLSQDKTEACNFLVQHQTAPR